MQQRRPRALQPGNPGRRRFLTDSVRIACGVGVLGLGLALHTRRAGALGPAAIRPPGALAEEAFLAACVRCGRCVRDCPYDILRLGRLGDGVALGTPWFLARAGACEMCEEIPCLAACPTGALDPALENIDDARMGLAVLIDQETCIAFRGLRCEVCFSACPVRGKAITLEYQPNTRTHRHARFLPVVHSDACTGCGKCEYACILEEAAIRVLPTHLAKGEMGRHYRLGWEEKRKAGGSLVAPDKEHRFNMPEGVQYDLDRGFVEGGNGGAPFAEDPLETLNRGVEGR